MAELQENTIKSKPKTHDFLSCFGFSRKIYTRKSLETMKSGRRRRNPLFSLFRIKEKKTVPVDLATAAPEKEDDNFPATHEKSTSKSKPLHLAGVKLRPALSDENDEDTNWSEHVQKNILENGKSPENSHSSKSVGRRIDPTGIKVINKQSSPVKIFVKRKLTRQSLSLPTLNPKPEKTPTAGMFIITLALLIILLWGKLCAIICISAWLYILPRLNSSSESKIEIAEKSQNLNNVEVNSDLYMKKMVVFEGFVRRSHRSTVAI